MGLRDEFKLARSHILHQDPLPTVSQAIHKLVDNETRLTLFPLPLETEVGELTEGKTGVTVCETVVGVARTMVWIELGSV